MFSVPSHSWGLVVRCCEYPHRRMDLDRLRDWSKIAVLWPGYGTCTTVLDQTSWEIMMENYNSVDYLFLDFLGSKMILPQGSSGRPLAKYGNMIEHNKT